MNKACATTLLGLALVFGCEKVESGQSASPATKPADKLMAEMGKAGEHAAEAGKAALAAGKEAGAAAAAKANSIAAAASEQAQKLLDQASQYIKDHKWDLADETLKKVDAMKEKLPAEWAAKVESMRRTLDNARAAAPATNPSR